MSKLINQTRLNQFTTKIWSKIKEKYNVSFKEVTLTDDKKLKFTKIEGTNTVDIDLVEYARLKDRNAFKQDVSVDNVSIESNRHIGDPNRDTSENRSLGFRGLTSDSFVDGYVSELVILVDSEAVVGSSTTWKVWAIKKGEEKGQDVVKKLIQQNGRNDIQTNVLSFNDNGTMRKCVMIPINEEFDEEVYFIVRSQNTRCNVCENIDPKYHSDVVNMTVTQPPITPGSPINWDSGANTHANTAIMYLIGRESIGSLYNKIKALEKDSSKFAKLDDNGKLDKNMLPSIAINEYFTVTEFTHNALQSLGHFENGDVVVVSNGGVVTKRYLCVDKEHNTDNFIKGFVELNSKDGMVQSVNGKSGAVTLALEATNDKVKLNIGSGSDTTTTEIPVITEDEINRIIESLS